MPNVKTLDAATRHLALALACLIGEQRSACYLHLRQARAYGVSDDEIMQLVQLAIPAVGLWRASAFAREVADFLAGRGPLSC